ncbi:MAG: class I tRNA ligase family protein, partial [Erysipelothrix sp.]|nr:class I tRNA ligase family protein [Erysipelothrix sp.]
VGNELVSFIWDDFCDWYIELSKVTLSGNDPQAKAATQYTLYVALEAIVKLLHPFMPFVSEEIYQTLTQKESIVISEWPKPLDNEGDDFKQVDQLISMISSLRELRLSRDVKRDVPLKGWATDQDDQLIDFDAYIQQVLAHFVNFELVAMAEVDTLVSPMLSGTLHIINENIEDVEKEMTQLQEQIQVLEKELKRSKGMLSNENFIKKAKPEKVAAEKAKYEEYQRQHAVLMEKLKDLQVK